MKALYRILSVASLLASLTCVASAAQVRHSDGQDVLRVRR